jgi:hypothetical protein
MTSYLKMATVEDKAMCVLRYFERQRLYRTHVVSVEKMHLQTMLSGVAQSNFKRLRVLLPRSKELRRERWRNLEGN